MNYLNWFWNQGGKPLLFALMFNREVQLAVGGTLIVSSARWRAVFAEFMFGQKGARFRGKNPGLIRRSIDMKLNLYKDLAKATERQWKVKESAGRFLRFVNQASGKKPLGWASILTSTAAGIIVSQHQMAEDHSHDPIAAIPLEPGENPMPVSMSRPGLGVM